MEVLVKRLEEVTTDFQKPQATKALMSEHIVCDQNVFQSNGGTNRVCGLFLFVFFNRRH